MELIDLEAFLQFKFPLNKPKVRWENKDQLLLKVNVKSNKIQISLQEVFDLPFASTGIEDEITYCIVQAIEKCLNNEELELNKLGCEINKTIYDRKLET